MKRFWMACFILVMVMIGVGCENNFPSMTSPTYNDNTLSNTPQNTATPGDSIGFISIGVPANYKETTVPEMEAIIGNKLPLPTYLPNECKIKDIYYHIESDQNPQSPQHIDIYVFVSDDQLIWINHGTRCRMTLEIRWNEFGAGLKMPGLKYIQQVPGRLDDRGDIYQLWWERYGSYPGMVYTGSTLILDTSKVLSLDELIKIANSTPLTN